MSNVDFKTVSESEPEEGRKVLAVEVGVESFRGAMEKEYARLGRRVRIPGFRKGKAPRSVLEAKYGDAVRAEALEKIVSDAAWQSLREKEIVPFFDPEIDDLTAKEGEPIRFTVSVDSWPKVVLNKCEGFEFTRKVPPVSDEDIDRELDGLRHQNVDYISVERAAIRGDRLRITYQRFLEDGSSFGKRIRDAELILEAPPGSDVVPATLTEKLEGIEKGEKRSVWIDFPPDHAARSLAGKKVEFRIEALEVMEKMLLPLDDAFASRVMGRKTTLEELREKIREGLAGRLEEEADRALRREIFETLLRENSVVVSDRIRERVARESMPRFVPDEEIPAEEREEARRRKEQIRRERREGSFLAIQKLALVTEISKRENLEPSEKEVAAATRAVLARRGRSVAGDERRAAEEQVRKDVRRALREEKVLDWIREHSTVNEG